MKPKTSITGTQVHSIFYGFGVIGACIYFIQGAETVWQGIVGIGEAIFWPAVLVYKVFEYLHL